MKSRGITNKLLEAAESGELLWETLARAALGYMPEAEVADMFNTEDLLFEDVEDSEDD